MNSVPLTFNYILPEGKREVVKLHGEGTKDKSATNSSVSILSQESHEKTETDENHNVNINEVGVLAVFFEESINGCSSSCTSSVFTEEELLIIYTNILYKSEKRMYLKMAKRTPMTISIRTKVITKGLVKEVLQEWCSFAPAKPATRLSTGSSPKRTPAL